MLTNYIVAQNSFLKTPTGVEGPNGKEYPVSRIVG